MNIDELRNSYFEWMYGLVCSDIKKSYKRLFLKLNDTQFIYTLPMDGNRAVDGADLRYRFGYENDISDHTIANYLDVRPCSVLEMMVALSLRCEEDIMTNPEKGNRTGKWFWTMISNLNLDTMYDRNYNERYVEYAVNKFMYHKYAPNGNGGLFKVKYPLYDMRMAEIWYQMNWYLSELGVDA